jgi:uncharacterized protein (DUF779 family)
MAGIGSIFGACTWLCLIQGFIFKTPRLTFVRAAFGLALATPVLIFIGTVVSTFLPVLMDRMSITGHQNIYLADNVVAVLHAALTLAYSGGFAIPLFTAASCKRRTQIIAVLILLSLSALTYTSLNVSPYSPTAPKRITFMHLHRTVAGAASASSPLCPPDAPCMMVKDVRFAIGSIDSTPLAWFMAAAPTTLISILAKNPLKHTRTDFAPSFPLDILVEQMVTLAPPSQQPLLQEPDLPYLAITSVGPRPDGATGRRAHLSVYTPLPCWMILNFTGPITGWSWTTELNPTKIPLLPQGVTKVQHVVRLSTEQSDPRLSFWVEDDGSGPLAVDLTASYMQDTDITLAFIKALPPWASSCFHCTSYQSLWTV